MHIWTNLLAREGALFAILAALGAAPVSFLSGRFDGAGRLALAPILGFCLGTCVATTVLEFAPARQTYSMLPVLALVSLGLAAWRTRTRRDRRHWKTYFSIKDLTQLAIIVLAVAGPLTYTLHDRHTVGPAAYTYTDVDNYIGEQDGAEFTSIKTARRAWENSLRTGSRFSDLTQWDWSFLTDFDANLNATPLDANVNALLGLGATDTYSAFLIVFLLAGALGAFATVRYATHSSTWLAVLAGALFGGPLFLELWFDTFQSAIIALGLLMPFLVIGIEMLRERSISNVVLLALVVGSLFTVYPLYVPVLISTSILVLVILALVLRRRRKTLRDLARPVAARIAALMALAITFDVVGFIRNVGYYDKLLKNEVPLPRVGWHLSLGVLPGWLLQTREFWYMPTLGTGGPKQILLGALLPLILLCFIAVGVYRHRIALGLVALAGVCALVAEYAYTSNNSCTYCAERDLLPLAPIGLVLLTLGLATVIAMPQRWARMLGVAGIVLVLAAVGQRSRVELTRFVHGSYFLDSANRSVLSHLPTNANAVQLEGFGETTSAQAEQPLVYRLANEILRGRVSIALGSNLYNAIEYLDFGTVKAPGPEFHPEYEYVLTRLAGIDTSRTVIAHSGGIALERRTQPLDIVTYSGIVAPLNRLDQTGTAWVQPELPLQMYISGRTPGRVWVRLTFAGRGPLAIAPQPGVWARTHSDTLVACVLTSGSVPVRSASIRITAGSMPGAIPTEEFPPLIPQEGVALVSMRAVVDRCTP